MPLAATIRRLLETVSVRRRLSIDIETRSELYFGKGPKNVGLDRYSRHHSTRILMIAYQIDFGEVLLWDCTDGSEMPSDLAGALADPLCDIWAFNAQFERVMLRECWGMDIAYERWRCTMVLGYQLSFIGGLDEIGECVGLPDQFKKDKEGERLIKLFSSPQRVTKVNPHEWRDATTDPVDWARFKAYCKRDVVAESEIARRLEPYETEGWALYHLDQMQNDRGLPVDRQFLTAASAMAARRKAELTAELTDLTGLANPNSSPQLTAWLVERGYPFNDIGKDTVSKVLNEHEEAVRGEGHVVMTFNGGDVVGQARIMTDEVVRALKLRKQVARTSPKKFDAVLYRLVDGDDYVRYAFAFAGASRTNRWASRGGVQLHNMPRTPPYLEDVGTLKRVTEMIRQGDYDAVAAFCRSLAKPVDVLDAIVGCVRSMLRAPDGYEFVVCDLSSIETVGVGVLSNCQRILNVFRQGKDAYKDFGTIMFKKPYDEITKHERQMSKPAVLAGGFLISGGELEDGRRTGLWAYAENMSINMTREEAHKAVDAYHTAYPEVKPYAYSMTDAIIRTIRTRAPTDCGLIRFDLQKPFLRMRLPSGRYIYYHLPKVHEEQRVSKRTGNEYTARVITVMGKSEAGNKWVRRQLTAGVAIENADQAMCRDILGVGMLRAHEDGFDLRGSVHDELITLRKIGDSRYSSKRLGVCLTTPIGWLPDGTPLGSDGFEDVVYRK